MSKVIYRFPIDMEEAAATGGRVELVLPLGARILYVAAQERAPNQPSMWVLLDPAREPVRHVFRIYSTGQEGELPPDYIGTWQQHGFVWHLFEELEETSTT